MSDVRQALLGILVALISSGIVLGSIALALMEGKRQTIAQVQLPSPTLSPMLLTPVNTPAPGEPTFTSSPTSISLPEETPQPTPRCQPPSGWVKVDILPGDTLELLAELYGLPADELLQRNCLGSDFLQPGTFIFAPEATPTLVASATLTPLPTEEKKPEANKPAPRCGPPSGWLVYYVRQGDTLYRLAGLTGTTVANLQRANCLGSSTTIRVGQRLWVPRLPPVSIPTRTPTRRPPTFTPTFLPPITTVPTATPTAVPSPTSTTPPLPTDTPQPTPTTAPPDTLTPLPSNTPETPPP